MRDPHIQDRWKPDYPWGQRDEEFERELAEEMAIWGEEGRVLGLEHPPEDPEFVRWDARISRFAATPGSMAAFSQMWFETDVRDILPKIRVPAIVLYKTESADGAEPAAYVASLIPGARAVAVPGREWTLWFEDPELLVAPMEAFLASVRKEEAAFDRVLATVLFTDIVGSTEAAASMGDQSWGEVLERHHLTVRGLLARYRGNEMDTAGDGFFATFDGPARAVRCAEAIIESVQVLDLEVRAGIHAGEVETIDGKVGGIAVNIGARVAAKASASEVLVSQTVKDLVARLRPDFRRRRRARAEGHPRPLAPLSGGGSRPLKIQSVHETATPPPPPHPAPQMKDGMRVRSPRAVTGLGGTSEVEPSSSEGRVG